MRQTQTVFTPLSITIAVFIFGIIGIRFWQHGGLLFNPGKLTAKSLPGIRLNGFQSHAEFEDQCSLCHQPLSSSQGVLCLQCHVNIDEQILTPDGLHGQFPSVIQCLNCHSDHQGRDFDPTASARNGIDHNLTGFSLTLHTETDTGQPINCDECHLPENGFDFEIDKCQQCHSMIDSVFTRAHLENFGTACLDCHDGVDRMSGFDHSSLAFSLAGKHSEVSCAECHQNKVFRGLPADCLSCHAEPPLHAGLFGTSCQDCHSPDGWTPAVVNGEVFDHNQHTGFSLAKHTQNFNGSQFQCLDCHINLENVEIQTTCSSCHLTGNAQFTEPHIAQVGPNCLECHDGADRMASFDHNAIFQLTNSHSDAPCLACHTGGTFQDTPANCSSCHSEPTIHAGFFGLNCEYCHTTVAWTPAELKNHIFPLDHGSDAQLNCSTCHSSTYTEYTCYGCHEHNQAEIEQEHIEEGISLDELSACASCHPDGREEGD